MEQSNDNLRRVLLKAQQADINIEVDGDSLLVRGNPDRQDIYDEIRELKPEILYALQNIPDAVYSYYIPRLEKGIGLMEECLTRLKKDPNNEKLHMFLVSCMHKWAMVDEEMRRVFPEFTGCPVDTCNSSVPVRCVHCATELRKLDWKKLQELT